MKAVNAYYRKHKTLDGCPNCAAGLVIVVAVYIIGTAGSSLIDCVIGRFCFRGCLLRRVAMQGKGLAVKIKFLFRGQACLR